MEFCRYASLLYILIGLFQTAFAFTLNSSPGASTEFGSEFGYQGSQTNRSLLYALPYLKQTLQPEESSSQWEFFGSVRGALDTRGDMFGTANSGTLKNEIMLRSFSASLSWEKVRITAGFQEIPWGETFGFPVLDIVNPRDYRDPLMLDTSWIRLPVAAVNTQLFLDRLTVQMIFTPLARSTLLPESGSPYDPVKDNSGFTLQSKSSTDFSNFGYSSEYGGKISYLFENGLDLGFMVFRHWNRNPVYTLTAAPTSAGLEYFLSPRDERVYTLGNSFSITFDRLVARFDQAIHGDQPVPGTALGTVEKGTQWQSVLGTDLTTDDQWTFGLQFQTEYDFLPSGDRFLKWINARISRPFFERKLEPEIFFFLGVGNTDLWFQPKLTWNCSEFLSLSLRGDLVRHSGSMSEGYLWIARDQSRLLLWVTAKI